MEKVELTAQTREEAGKGAVRRLRREGYIPAVLYGPSIKTTSLSIKDTDLSRILGKKKKGNVLIDLSIEGSEQKEATSGRTVLLKEIQRNPLKRNIIHVDLYEVMAGHKISVSVPIHIIGEAKGVDKGGILQHDVRELDIECLPIDLPERIDVDVTELDIGNSVHVRDLEIGKKITFLSDEGATVVSIVTPAKEIEVKTAEEVEEEIAGSFEETEGKEIEKE